ncbi:MAG: hypothetical protein ACE15B_13150 [Bryobacteraceae bacterium]
MTRRTAAFLMLAPALVPDSRRKKLEIRGIYSSPRPFWDRGIRLADCGVNAVFVHAGSITPELMARAEAEGARVFAEFPTLNGKGYVEKHPEAWPIDERGEKAPPAAWFLGACPTDPGFRAWRMSQLTNLLDRFAVAGVWMDYFHWHAQFEEPRPILPETCFSPTCLAAFEAASGVRVPPGAPGDRARWLLRRHEREWRLWRTRQLLDWARGIRNTLRAKRPGALLGIFHCPWTDEEFGGARRRILGLDLEELAAIAGVFSPMVYHGRMERPPEWAGQYVEWLSGKIGARAQIWPIVQAHDKPRRIPPEEFEKVLRLGAAAAATGVMMFTGQDVARDAAKLEVMRRVYRESS